MNVNVPTVAAIAIGADTTDVDPNIAASICVAMFLPRSFITDASAAVPFCAKITFERFAYPVNLFGVKVTFAKSAPPSAAVATSAAHATVDPPAIGNTVSAATVPRLFNPTLL